MFSVGLLYSSRDFLKLIPNAGMTPSGFKNHFKVFKYSTADKILDVCFKCGWSKLTQSGQIELSDRGKAIAITEYRSALLFQLEDLILNFNPVWASVLTKGRTEAKNFLPQDASQCFKECGLFDELNDEIIGFWDKLSLAYRNYSQKRMAEIGRAGEKLSYDHEKERTTFNPTWQSVESNLAGFDVLSVLSFNDRAKLKIEVKATTSNIEFAKIHITKNEWNTAINSLNYIFHLWYLTDIPKLYIVTVEEMKNHIPLDNGEGDWESVEVPFKLLTSHK